MSYWVEWHCDNFTEKYIQTIIGRFAIRFMNVGYTPLESKMLKVDVENINMQDRNIMVGEIGLYEFTR